MVYFASVRHSPPEPHVFAGINHVGESALRSKWSGHVGVEEASGFESIKSEACTSMK